MKKMGSQSSNSLGKPMRRRSHTRKTAQGSVINMAEVRREIAHALHLHRSSTKTTSYVIKERDPWMLSNVYSCSTKEPTLATSYCCCSLVEAMPMPLPEPLWSTTAPSVAAALPAPGLEAMDSFEWGKKQASSYPWWLGFLRALDANNIEKTKHPFEHNIIVKENSQVCLEQQEIRSKLGEPANFVGASDQNAYLDDWLMFPTPEDDKW